jgi:hypothetical protein
VDHTDRIWNSERERIEGDLALSKNQMAKESIRLANERLALHFYKRGDLAVGFPPSNIQLHLNTFRTRFDAFWTRFYIFTRFGYSFTSLHVLDTLLHLYVAALLHVLDTL